MLFVVTQVYRCNDHVPEAVYWELPKRIQEQVKQMIQFCSFYNLWTMNIWRLCSNNNFIFSSSKSFLDTWHTTPHSLSMETRSCHHHDLHFQLKLLHRKLNDNLYFRLRLIPQDLLRHNRETEEVQMNLLKILSVGLMMICKFVVIHHHACKYISKQNKSQTLIPILICLGI